MDAAGTSIRIPRTMRRSQIQIRGRLPEALEFSSELMHPIVF
jgi:hypothetical protein